MTQPPHDEPTASSPEELREQVEQTRAELGETVEALAAKTDVKASAEEQAAEVKEQAAAKAGELKGQAARKAGELKTKAADLAHQVQDRLPDPVKDKTAQAAGQAKAKAAQAGQLWEEKAPEPVRQKTAQGHSWRGTTATCCWQQPVRPSWCGWSAAAGRGERDEGVDDRLQAGRSGAGCRQRHARRWPVQAGVDARPRRGRTGRHRRGAPGQRCCLPPPCRARSSPGSRLQSTEPAPPSQAV